MKKILAFSGGNRKQSINKALAAYAVGQASKASGEVIDLVDYEAPIYNQDLEEEQGIPQAIVSLQEKLDEADAYIIALPEHNGLPPAAFKNTIDWLSRHKQGFFGQKPILLLSASPGKFGGANALSAVEGLFKWWGGEVIGKFSIGEYHAKIDESGALKDEESVEALRGLVESIQNKIEVVDA
ncbi:NADPH-dependent FMN reductase [Aureibacter tunicatorum]|uniref:NAD(P)H-dependent FMN reductase n=1 Tax=Aureibacter tunicatorum TaxID=866807 RepID=A0AAE4BU41_9BACT|nr:NAD(P)H-dependent oxidoreductase [Aureibacter tunicatorum]MDR6240327.1 NAD(P)H-dependent FMN reductase [Aureibacter tunicatorum]BDD05792.1 FMN reductase [Aureibacter tunicatorum]